MGFPKTYNLDYYRGDTFEFKVYTKNQDGTEFDVSGYETFTFKLANQRGSSGTQITATATKESDAEGSYVKCTITPTVGRSLSAGTYVYDVQITDTTPTPAVIYTIVTGIITVTDDISGAV